MRVTKLIEQLLEGKYGIFYHKYYDHYEISYTSAYDDKGNIYLDYEFDFICVGLYSILGIIDYEISNCNKNRKDFIDFYYQLNVSKSLILKEQKHKQNMIVRSGIK